MRFQQNDIVLWHGLPCRVAYANEEIVATCRLSDANISIMPPRDLAEHQVPWVQDGRGWLPSAALASQQHCGGRNASTDLELESRLV